HSRPPTSNGTSVAISAPPAHDAGAAGAAPSGSATASVARATCAAISIARSARVMFVFRSLRETDVAIGRMRGIGSTRQIVGLARQRPAAARKLEATRAAGVAELGRRASGPALDRAMERADLGEPEHEGDLGDRGVAVLEVVDRALAADVVDQRQI